MSEKPQIELEKTVRQWYAAGMKYCEARLKADQLDDDTKSYLSSLMNALAKVEKDASESKLDRLARGSEEFRRHIDACCMAKADALRAKVRYDALGALLDAKRSVLAFERATVEKGIFDVHGGGRNATNQS